MGGVRGIGGTLRDQGIGNRSPMGETELELAATVEGAKKCA